MTEFDLGQTLDEEIAKFRKRPKRAEIMAERNITEADLERYRRLTRADLDEVTQQDIENMYELSYTPDSRCNEFPLGWSAEHCEKCGQIYVPSYLNYLDERGQYQSIKLRHPACFPHDGDDVRGRDRTSQALSDIGVPNRMTDRRFSNFRTDTPSRLEAMRNARALIAGRISGLLLMGAAGTGKTHLAVGLMAVLIEHDKRVTYRTELQIKSELKKAAGFSSKTSTDDVRTKYVNAPNLIIDRISDEGRETTDEAEKHFTEIIIERLDTYGTRTLLISGMTPERFNQRFGDSIRSRLNREGASVVLAERYESDNEEAKA